MTHTEYPENDRRHIRAKGAARKAERNERILATGGKRKRPLREMGAVSW